MVIREVGEPAKSEVAAKPESGISDGPSFCRWHPTEMNAPAEAFRCQALAKEIAAELQHSLPVNVCLLQSSIMIRAAPWEVLGTSALWTT
jgi:hypothetical protein